MRFGCASHGEREGWCMFFNEAVNGGILRAHSWQPLRFCAAASGSKTEAEYASKSAAEPSE